MTHRFEPAANSSSAAYCNTKEVVWQQWLDAGRTLIMTGSWEGACLSYKRALDAAEKILCHRCVSPHCHDCDVKRYLRTVEEFAYAMRRNNYDNAADALIAYVETQLADHISTSELEHLVKALATLNQASDAELEQRFKSRLAS